MCWKEEQEGHVKADSFTSFPPDLLTHTHTVTSVVCLTYAWGNKKILNQMEIEVLNVQN